MGMNVLPAPVIASDQGERGNPTVLVLKDSGIAEPAPSGACPEPWRRIEGVALLPRNDPGL